MLKEHQAGIAVMDLSRKHGIGDETPSRAIDLSARSATVRSDVRTLFPSVFSSISRPRPDRNQAAISMGPLAPVMKETASDIE